MVNRLDKIDYYLNIARSVSKRSTCLKRHYGCVIVKNDEIIATGYNGAARGNTNCCDVFTTCPRFGKAHNSGDYSDCPAVHAEQNALISASRSEMIGATMYLAGYDYSEDGNNEMHECYPCPICERMIRNSGIAKVVGPQGLVMTLSKCSEGNS